MAGNLTDKTRATAAAAKIGKLELVLIMVMFFLAVATTVEIYKVTGFFWDFTVNILDAKAYLTPQFWAFMFSGHAVANIVTAPTFYSETFRDPLAYWIMTAFVAVNDTSAIVVYQVMVVALLLLALFYYSRTTGASLLLLVLVFFNPFVIVTLFLLDGEEGVSLILMILTIALLIKKRWEMGMVLALAGLAKYPSLIFLPLILFLPTTRKKVLALLGFIVVTLPFLLLNYSAYDNPIEPYIAEMYFFKIGSPVAASAFYLSISQIFIFLVPAIILLGLFAMARWTMVKQAFGNLRNKISSGWLYSAQAILLATIILGAIGWLYLAKSPSIDSTPRMGYLLYIGIGLGIGSALSALTSPVAEALKRSMINRRSIATSVLFVIGATVFIYYFIFASQAKAVNTVGSSWPGFTNASGTLAAHGFANCSVISNAWVYVYYNHVVAYQSYSNNSIVARMPGLVYYTAGDSPLSINTSRAIAVFNYSEYKLVIPPNATCVPG